MNINITISKTQDGLQDYIQIISEDSVAVNIVLVAECIAVEDHRDRKKPNEG